MEILAMSAYSLFDEQEPPLNKLNWFTVIGLPLLAYLSPFILLPVLSFYFQDPTLITIALLLLQATLLISEQVLRELIAPTLIKLGCKNNGFLVLFGVPTGAVLILFASVITGDIAWQIACCVLFYRVAMVIEHQLQNYTIEYGYHKGTSHKQFKLSIIAVIVTMLYGAKSLEGSLKMWASWHRVHHGATDGEKTYVIRTKQENDETKEKRYTFKDPHSPVFMPAWFVKKAKSLIAYHFVRIRKPKYSHDQIVAYLWSNWYWMLYAKERTMVLYQVPFKEDLEPNEKDDDYQRKFKSWMAWQNDNYYTIAKVMHTIVPIAVGFIIGSIVGAPILAIIALFTPINASVLLEVITLSSLLWLSGSFLGWAVQMQRTFHVNSVTHLEGEDDLVTLKDLNDPAKGFTTARDLPEDERAVAGMVNGEIPVHGLHHIFPHASRFSEDPSKETLSGKTTILLGKLGILYDFNLKNYGCLDQKAIDKKKQRFAERRERYGFKS